MNKKPFWINSMRWDTEEVEPGSGIFDLVIYDEKDVTKKINACRLYRFNSDVDKNYIMNVILSAPRLLAAATILKTSKFFKKRVIIKLMIEISDLVKSFLK